FQNVYVANDGDEALGLYETVKPDALILDIDMPYIDGLSVAKNIRETNQNIPIVILTAFTDTDKLLYATELNLCKYLVKPVVPHDFKEALKKISLLLYALSSQYIFLSPTHTWDRQGKQLLHQGAPVKITQKEQMLLDLFISKRNQCIAFVEIMAVVWEDDIDSDVSIESVKLQVHYLRKKLPKNMIHNIYGKGYALRVAEV
ncbi:MAG: response regulator transcription factor, partial [Campylobacterota bacterium]|nr:response regulator transcription factor [Campylobacterota bacterium]